VNLIHEIFRQAFLLNFSWAMAIRRTIAVYKDWIQLSVCILKIKVCVIVGTLIKKILSTIQVSQQPPFMLDPDGTNVQMSSLDVS